MEDNDFCKRTHTRQGSSVEVKARLVETQLTMNQQSHIERNLDAPDFNCKKTIKLWCYLRVKKHTTKALQISYIIR